jgi:hypothetical protein
MRILWLCMAVLGVGCGDDDGGGLDCSAFTACGGDPVGSWNILGVCLGPDPDFIPGCDGETATTNVSTTGTVTVTASNYMTSVTSSGTINLTVPGSCLPTGVTSCEQLNGADQTCTGNVASSCACTGTVDSTDMEEGTYTTSGGMLTLMPTGGTPETLEYCVQGNTFRVRDGDSISVLGR